MNNLSKLTNMNSHLKSNCLSKFTDYHRPRVCLSVGRDIQPLIPGPFLTSGPRSFWGRYHRLWTQVPSLVSGPRSFLVGVSQPCHRFCLGGVPQSCHMSYLGDTQGQGSLATTGVPPPNTRNVPRLCRGWYAWCGWKLSLNPLLLCAISPASVYIERKVFHQH